METLLLPVSRFLTFDVSFIAQKIYISLFRAENSTNISL